MNILIIAALIVFALPIGVVVCLIIQNSDTNYQNEKDKDQEEFLRKYCKKQKEKERKKKNDVERSAQ